MWDSRQKVCVLDWGVGRAGAEADQAAVGAPAAGDPGDGGHGAGPGGRQRVQDRRQVRSACSVVLFGRVCGCGYGCRDTDHASDGACGVGAGGTSLCPSLPLAISE
eukprot:1850389-Rhodomonas_salina.7